MPNVEARPRGVGEHVENVELWTSEIVIYGFEGFILQPIALPLGFNLRRGVRMHIQMGMILTKIYGNSK
jgi:hypothetical protein